MDVPDNGYLTDTPGPYGGDGEDGVAGPAARVGRRLDWVDASRHTTRDAGQGAAGASRLRKVLLPVAVCLVLLGLSSAASAAVLDYELTCTNGDACANIGGGTVSFQLNQFPDTVYITGVPGILNGQAETFTVQFYSEMYNGFGGLNLKAPGVDYDLPGPQLYQGFRASPELVPGVFSLLGATGAKQQYNFELDVTLLDSVGSPAPVPEPAPWSVMIAGLGMTAVVLRRARRGVARTWGKRLACRGLVGVAEA